MEARTHRKGKKPYNQPRLTVYGSLQKLTKVKGGDRWDGGGKPRTRISGARP